MMIGRGLVQSDCQGGQQKENKMIVFQPNIFLEIHKWGKIFENSFKEHINHPLRILFEVSRGSV